MPDEPPILGPSQFPNETVRRAAESERGHFLKEYEKAVNHRNAVIKERRKLEEKWKKQKEEDARNRQQDSLSNASVEVSDEEDVGVLNEVAPMAIEEDMDALDLGVTGPAQQQNAPNSKYDFSQTEILETASPDERSAYTESIASSDFTATSPSSQSTLLTSPSDTKPPKKKRYGKFCMLPPKDHEGNTDHTWVRVVMDGVDEVGAHCGLFFISQTYERLVGDVGERIEEWVREGETMRLVQQYS
jgi:hypothetical protein